MNYWIINHHFSSYQEHNNFIGIPVKIDKKSGEPIRDDNGKMIPKLVNLASKISIGDRIAGKVAEKKALSKLKGPLFFDDPGWIDEVAKHLGSENMSRKIFMYNQKHPGKSGLMEAREAIKYIENKISVGRGKIINEEWDESGEVKTWTVKYPDGEVKEITYDFGS